MSGRYIRPVLCRLCGFPAPDGGVPVSQLDRRKLSEWCWRMMDTDLDEEGLEKAVFCLFCVADARLESQYTSYNAGSHQSSCFLSNIDVEIENHYRLFSCDPSIQPCAVMMDNLSPKQIAKALSGSSTRRKMHRCLYCCSTFRKKKILSRHIVKRHENVSTLNHHKKDTIRCNYLHCATFFQTEEEKEEHLQVKHKDRKYSYLCPFCKQKINFNLYKHVSICHKSEVTLKCKFSQICPVFFLSEQERLKHVQEVHVLNKFECIYCKTSYRKSMTLHAHIQDKHPDEMIWCKWYSCALYFLTEEDRDEHFQQVHFEKKKDGMFHCEKCSFETRHWSFLCLHISNMHENLQLKCPECPKVLKSHLLLKWHLKMHVQTKQVQHLPQLGVLEPSKSKIEDL